MPRHLGEPHASFPLPNTSCNFLPTTYSRDYRDVPADYVHTTDDSINHEKVASIDPEKETPMDTGNHSSDSGLDLDTTPNTVQMFEEEVSDYIFDLEKRLELTEVLSKQNKRNLLIVNKNQQILTSRMLRSEREDIKG